MPQRTQRNTKDTKNDNNILPLPFFVSFVVNFRLPFLLSASCVLPLRKVFQFAAGNVGERFGGGEFNFVGEFGVVDPLPFICPANFV
jgi:hypothetical protein